MLRSIGFFLFIQQTSRHALQRTHFVRSCGPSLNSYLLSDRLHADHVTIHSYVYGFSGFTSVCRLGVLSGRSVCNLCMVSSGLAYVVSGVYGFVLVGHMLPNLCVLLWFQHCLELWSCLEVGRLYRTVQCFIGEIMVEYRYIPVTLFVLFAVFTIKDLVVQSELSEPNTKEIPITRMGTSTFIGPTIKFMYW
jgi:hypothetical protein